MGVLTKNHKRAHIITLGVYSVGVTVARSGICTGLHEPRERHNFNASFGKYNAHVTSLIAMGCSISSRVSRPMGGICWWCRPTRQRCAKALKRCWTFSHSFSTRDGWLGKVAASLHAGGSVPEASHRFPPFPSSTLLSIETVVRNHVGDARYDLCCSCFGRVLCLRAICDTATMSGWRTRMELTASGQIKRHAIARSRTDFLASIFMP